MKRKFTFAAIWFFSAAVLSLGLAFNLHCLLSGQVQNCTVAVVDLLEAVMVIPEVRKLYLLLLALSAVAILYILLDSRPITVRSDMQQVTPTLQTPAAAGQGQFGTARWLSSKQYPMAFDEVLVDTGSPLIQQLMAEGRDDMESEANTYAL